MFESLSALGTCQLASFCGMVYKKSTIFEVFWDYVSVKKMQFSCKNHRSGDVTYTWGLDSESKFEPVL